jgi:hypothetical protein
MITTQREEVLYLVSKVKPAVCLNWLCGIPLRSCVKHSTRRKARNVLNSPPVQLSRTSRVFMADTIRLMDRDRTAFLMIPCTQLLKVPLGHDILTGCDCAAMWIGRACMAYKHLKGFPKGKISTHVAVSSSNKVKSLL